MEVVTRYARSGDLRIAYQVAGEGPLDVLVVPSWFSNIELDWELPRSALSHAADLVRAADSVRSTWCRNVRRDRWGHPAGGADR